MTDRVASFGGRASGGANPGAISLTLVVLALAGLVAHRVLTPAPGAIPAAPPAVAPTPTAPAVSSAPAEPPAPSAPSAAPPAPAPGVDFHPWPVPARPNEESSSPVRSRGLWYEGADGYRQAVNEATSDHRAMAVYFRTDWCPYCRKLDRGLLSDATVQAYLQTLVKVRINPDKGQAEKKIEKDFGATAYPWFSIVPPGAGRGGRVQGTTATPSDFIAECRRAAG